MGDRLHYIFYYALLFAFQTQFSNIMENRSGPSITGLNELENLLERPRQSTEYYVDPKELTEIEELFFTLERDIHRAMTEIPTSPRYLSRRRDLRRLRKKLRILRAEIKTLKTPSKQQHQRRIIFSRTSLQEHQKQLEDQERRGWFSRSCPNIPLELYDSDFDLIKWKSMNETVNFKEGLEDRSKILDKDFHTLYNRVMKKEEKTSALRNLSFRLDPRQQGPMRETDDPHLNQTHLRSQHSTETARPTAQFNNAVQVPTNQTRPSQDDDAIRRSSAPELPDHESDSPRDVSSLIARYNNAIRTATNQTQPSQGSIRDTGHPQRNQIHSRMQHSRETARPTAQFNNAVQVPTNQTRPSQETARPTAQFNNAVQVPTNQTRPSQNDNGIRRYASSAHPDRDSNSPRVKAKQEKVPNVPQK